MFQKNNQQSNTVLFRKRSLSHFVAIWPWVNNNKAKKQLLGKPSVLPLKKNKRAQKKSKPNKTVLCLFLFSKQITACEWKKKFGVTTFSCVWKQNEQNTCWKTKGKKAKAFVFWNHNFSCWRLNKKKVLFFYFVFFFFFASMFNSLKSKKKRTSFSFCFAGTFKCKKQQNDVFEQRKKRTSFWNKVLKLLLFLFCNRITIHYWVGRSFKSWLFCITYITG